MATVKTYMVSQQFTDRLFKYPIIISDELCEHTGIYDALYEHLTIDEVAEKISGFLGGVLWLNHIPVMTGTWSLAYTKILTMLSEKGRVSFSTTAADFAGNGTTTTISSTTGSVNNTGTPRRTPFISAHSQSNMFFTYIPVYPSSAVYNGKLVINNTTAATRHSMQIVIVSSDGIDFTLRFDDSNRGTATVFDLNGADLEEPSEYLYPDPYEGAGYSPSTAPGGISTGSFDFTEDGITGVHTPSLDLLNCGLITAWRPSKAILAQLASWLWVTTPGQVIQQLFGNPINAIIGLHIVPVSPPVDGGTNTIKFGNEDSHVQCPKITSQHVTVDCGSIKISPKYGSYMDYAPQTSAELFLPYVGGLPLDVNDVIDKTIAVKYQIDVLSGACVAYVFIDGTLHYQKAGGCAATAPITGSQMPNVISGVLSIVGSVAGAVATMGASGAGTAAKVASGIATGTSVAESAANMLKQSVSYAGTISGWAGLLGAQKPYLILSVPHAAIPGGQNTLMGYPAWVSGRVGDFSGYTECTVDRVTATRATDQEVEEIKALLAGGVIL